MPTIDFNNNNTNDVITNKVAIAHGYSFLGDNIIPMERLEQTYQGVFSFNIAAPVLGGTFVKWQGANVNDGTHNIIMPVSAVTDKIIGYVAHDVDNRTMINQDFRKSYVGGEPVAIVTKSAFVAWYSSVNNLVIGEELYVDITNVDLWKRGFVTNVALNNIPLGVQCTNKSSPYFTKSVKFNTTTLNYDKDATAVTLDYAVFNVNTF